MGELLSQEDVDVLLGGMADYFEGYRVSVKIEKAENGYVVTFNRKTHVFKTIGEVTDFFKEAVMEWSKVE